MSEHEPGDVVWHDAELECANCGKRQRGSWPELPAGWMYLVPGGQLDVPGSEVAVCSLECSAAYAQQHRR